MAAIASRNRDRFGARFVTMENFRETYVEEVEATFNDPDMAWVRKFHPRRFAHIVHDSLADGSDIAKIIGIAVQANAQFLYITNSPRSIDPDNAYNPMVSDDPPAPTLWEKEIAAVNDTEGHRFTGSFDEMSFVPFDKTICPLEYSWP